MNRKIKNESKRKTRSNKKFKSSRGVCYYEGKGVKELERIREKGWLPKDAQVIFVKDKELGKCATRLENLMKDYLEGENPRIVYPEYKTLLQELKQIFKLDDSLYEWERYELSRKERKKI
jgi:hypothetical protein